MLRKSIQLASLKLVGDVFVLYGVLAIIARNNPLLPDKMFAVAERCIFCSAHDKIV